MHTIPRREALGWLERVLAAWLILLLVWGPCPAWACFAVVVGRKASADGSVLLGHNEQNSGRRILNFRRIPRQRFEDGAMVQLRRGGKLLHIRETFAFLWSENPGLEFSDSYLNERGVAIVSDGCPTREDDYQALTARGEIRDGGIGYMLRRLVAQRARTSKEGVQIAGKLIERFGYVDSGRTYVIADPHEAWLLSVVRGRRWVAQRVPDDAVVLLPNVHIIAEVDLADRGNFLSSPDIIEYAINRGWLDPDTHKSFNFRQTYCHERDILPDPRQHRGQELVTGQTMSQTTKGPLPFAVKPRRKLTVADVIEILRDRESSPPISSPETQEAAVFQLRANLPREVGCVYWRTTTEPSTSVLTPWYLGISETPESYYMPASVREHLSLSHHFSPPQGTYEKNQRLAWWDFMMLQETVHENYEKRIEVVRPVWEAFEDRAFTRQRAVEKLATRLLRTDRCAAVSYLTRYCAEVALHARQEARKLIERLRDMKLDNPERYHGRTF